MDNLQNNSEKKLSNNSPDYFHKLSPIPTYIWRHVGEDFVLVDFNNPAVVITKGKIGDLLGTKASEMYHDQPDILNEFRHCFNGKATLEREMAYQLKTTGEQKYLAVKYAYRPPDLILIHTEDITNRKLAEEALKESEQRYRTLVETLQEGLGIVDPDENIIFANDAYAKIFGYSREEIVGMNLRDLIPEYEYKKILHETSKRRKGIASHYDLIMKRKDGKLINIRVSAAPWMSETGTFRGTIGVILDISEQVLAENALKIKERRYRELANLLPQIVLEIDPAGNINFLNHRGFESFGYAIQDIKDGLKIFQLFIPEEHDRIQKDILKTVIGEKLSGNEYIARKKNRTKFPIIAYSSPIIFEEKTVGLLWIAIDIGRRKRTEDAFLEDIKHHRALYDENPSIYFTVDEKGIILSINKEGAEQLGYSVEELMGQSVFNTYYEDDQKNVKQQFTYWLKNSAHPGHWEFRKIRKDSSVIWVKETARVVMGTETDRLILIACEDISERVKSRLDKETFLKELAEAEKLITLGQFTAALTHEINNPLDIIQNKLCLLQKSIIKNMPGTELLDHVNKITHQVNRIENLSKDLLNYMKPRLIKLESVNINKIINNAIHSLSDYFTDKITLKTNFNMNLPLIHGDAVGLEIVFKNLLLNAIESLKDRRRIDITTGMFNNELLEVSIKDSGIGIPEKDLSRIFDPFFTSKRKTGGTGLGLAICKKIIDEHEGIIQIESRPHVGTSVIVQFKVK